MKQILLYALIFTCASCGSTRTLEGRARPVYISADTSLFSDSLRSVLPVWYASLQGLQGNSLQTAELVKGKTTKVYIVQPTFFYKGMDNGVLLYPGEHIRLSGSEENCTFSAADGNAQRNSELLVFKTFEKLEQRPPLVPRHLEPSLQTILDLEKEQKDAIPKAEARSQLIFDSLLQANGVSEKFRNLTKNYVHHRYDNNLTWLYKLYKDTLTAHGLYGDKFRQLAAPINDINQRAEFTSNVQYQLNSIYEELFPNNKMYSMADEKMFRACFDSAANHFSALARDYLLSRVMQRAYVKGLSVPPVYKAQYLKYSLNKDYRRIVANTRKEQPRHTDDKKVKKNLLLATDGKTELRLEQVLAQYRGQLVYIDLWASWCLPCLKELPYLEKLREQHASDKIVFLTLSFDKQVSLWQQSMMKHAVPRAHSFLLLNAPQSSFSQQYQITEIPRYLLLDKTGRLISANAPAPSEPALNELLNKHLLE